MPALLNAVSMVSMQPMCIKTKRIQFSCFRFLNSKKQQRLPLRFLIIIQLRFGIH